MRTRIIRRSVLLSSNSVKVYDIVPSVLRLLVNETEDCVEFISKGKRSRSVSYRRFVKP